MWPELPWCLLRLRRAAEGESEQRGGRGGATLTVAAPLFGRRLVVSRNLKAISFGGVRVKSSFVEESLLIPMAPSPKLLAE